MIFVPVVVRNKPIYFYGVHHQQSLLEPRAWPADVTDKITTCFMPAVINFRLKMEKVDADRATVITVEVKVLWHIHHYYLWTLVGHATDLPHVVTQNSVIISSKSRIWIDGVHSGTKYHRLRMEPLPLKWQRVKERNYLNYDINRNASATRKLPYKLIRKVPQESSFGNSWCWRRRKNG